jgi:hypothetical protein
VKDAYHDLPKSCRATTSKVRNISTSRNGVPYNGSTRAAQIPHAVCADAIPARNQGTTSAPTATPILLRADPIRNLQPGPEGMLHCQILLVPII